jgi:GxxExxY protein
MGLVHAEITEQIIGAAFEVHGVLGYGFLEKVYQQSMKEELRRRGLIAETEWPITVRYKGAIVGDYRADLFVAGIVIVELKVAREYQSAAEAQLLNELRATGVKVGLLINIGRHQVEYKRMVF